MQNISWKFWIKTFIVLPFDHCDYVRKCNHFHQYIRKCNHFHLYVRKCNHFHLYVRKCNHFHLYYLPFYNQDFFKFTILKFVLKGIIYTVFNRVAKWFFLKISNVTFELLTLHKKWSFPLRISSVNVTKSTDSCGFGHIYWRNPSCKTSFFCAVTCHCFKFPFACLVSDLQKSWIQMLSSFIIILMQVTYSRGKW